MVTALTSTVDLAHGGRWTSLRGGDREWLWHRPDPARSRVRPGDAFVDAGGIEECLPTVRGKPDHGAVWSRPWRRLDVQTAGVAGDDFELTRTVRHAGGAVVAEYRLSAVPGWSFVWAAHALLELSDEARLVAPAGTVTRVYDDARGLIAGDWPDGASWKAGEWPRPLGLPLDRLGRRDGTAVGAILTGCPRVSVVDGTDELTLSLTAEGQPVSVALWRNLGGFPRPDPYRSIGVEPMLGNVFDVAEAGPGDAAVVPPSGVCSWRLVLRPGS
jgi:hypothetical protein